MQIWLGGLAIAAAMGTGTAAAQTALGATEPPCTFRVNAFGGMGWENRTGAPFSLTLKSTLEQKLPDGNVIRGYSMTHEARNAAGTTRTEMAQNCMRGEDGQLHLRYGVSVYDMETKTFRSWSVGPEAEKVVRTSRPAERREQTPEEAAAMKERMAIARLQEIPRKEFKTENLGTRNILGVIAEGSRTTRTIPAGEEGNEQPLETMTERWRAKDLGITLLMIQDDPRSGKRTYEVVELNLGEPDAALFAAPEGYKAKTDPAVADLR